MTNEEIFEHGEDCRALLDNAVFQRVVSGMTEIHGATIFATKPEDNKARSIVYYQQLALQQIVALLQHGKVQAERLAEELEDERENQDQ